MASLIHPVVLSGGSGRRLWPLSRTTRPKQLLPLVTEHSMLQQTVLRVRGPGFGPPTVICGNEQRFLIAEQLREIDVEPGAIVLEPVGRSTAPAITVAALRLAASHPDSMMLVLPADHVMQDVEGFRAAVDIAAQAARRGHLLTFGITPSRPETGYGYIRYGPPVDGVVGCFRVEAFVEKPSAEEAKGHIDRGRSAWNSGVFLFPVRLYLDEMTRLRAATVDGCRAAVEGSFEDLDFVRLAREPFEALDSESIDYALMENTEHAAVVPVDIGWNDVGSWSTLWDIGDRDRHGNVTAGAVLSSDVKDSYLRAEGPLVAAIGVRDMIIVATDDAVLVVPRQRAAEVRDIVEQIRTAGRSEHYAHRRVFRPWGWYHAIDAGDRFQVKQIMVNPGHRLSDQMHHHRAEHWVVVSGTAKVTRGNETFFVTEDQSTYIPLSVRHSLENPGKIPLRLIEVQSGPYLGEDDIVRFDDVYGRAEAAGDTPSGEVGDENA